MSDSSKYRVSSTLGWEQALVIRFIARHPFLSSLPGTPSYCLCEAPFPIVVARHPFLLSLSGTPSYCHCEAPFPIVIVRRPFLLSLRGTPSYCRCEAQSAEAISTNTPGLPRLQRPVLLATNHSHNEPPFKLALRSPICHCLPM